MIEDRGLYSNYWGKLPGPPKNLKVGSHDFLKRK